MDKFTAVYYGQVEIIPGVRCDSYVLSDETAVMSENGTAGLLNIDQKALNRMRTKGMPKVLLPFLPQDFSLQTIQVKVVAKNSPRYGAHINVYTAEMIENLITAYALALGHEKLHLNQRHIGLHCVVLQSSLIKTALEAAIKDSCGFIVDIQKTVQRFYKDTLFIFQREILLNALMTAYPAREPEKYRGLMATCFKYCYEDTLGKELYKKIKKQKKSYAFHQYIEDNRTRQLCACYINTLASQIAIRKCRIAEARKYTREMMQKSLKLIGF